MTLWSVQVAVSGLRLRLRSAAQGSVPAPALELRASRGSSPAPEEPNQERSASVSCRNSTCLSVGASVVGASHCSLSAHCALVRISSHPTDNKVVYRYFQEAACGNFRQPSAASSATLSVEIPTNTTQNATETEGTLSLCCDILIRDYHSNLDRPVHPV